MRLGERGEDFPHVLRRRRPSSAPADSQNDAHLQIARDSRGDGLVETRDQRLASFTVSASA